MQHVWVEQLVIVHEVYGKSRHYISLEKEGQPSIKQEINAPFDGMNPNMITTQPHLDTTTSHNNPNIHKH